MSMGAVENHHVHFCVHQGAYPLQYIGCNADPGSAQKPSLCVLCRKRIFDGLFNVLDGDQPHQVIIVVYNRKLFLSCFGQNLLCLLKSNPCPGSDQALGSHGFFDLFGKISLKLKISVGDNPHQLTSFRHRYAGNPELGHKGIRIRQGMLRRQRKGIRNNTVLGTLYLVHFLCLCLDGHIFVNYTDSALPCHGNCHPVLRDGIHPRTHHRDIQPDLRGKPSG